MSDTAAADRAVRRKIIAALVRVRRELGVTQVEMARAMQISQVSVSQIEHSDDPHLSTLQRYARALGIRFGLEIEVLGPDQPQERDPG
jgi:transcriptional regulator with XRE-family HTH domain